VKLDENEPTPSTAYLPYTFLQTRDLGLMVRTEAAPSSIMNAVRTAFRETDPSIPLFKVWEMQEVKRLSFWMYGVWGTMFAIFAGIALFLAGIGVYAVISHGVTRRTREIGVRMALGARQSGVIALIVKQGVRLAGLGLGVGVVGALGMSPVVAELLIGVSPFDVTSYVAVIAFLGVIAFVACYIPALRAANVNPTVAMREE
jgi:ABC-type antimicrobial peptide transport system permease subunit